MNGSLTKTLQSAVRQASGEGNPTGRASECLRDDSTREGGSEENWRYSSSCPRCGPGTTMSTIRRWRTGPSCVSTHHPMDASCYSARSTYTGAYRCPRTSAILSDPELRELRYDPTGGW
ncbi:hypothetical protein [Pseudomonas phage PIP]|nr:hypothetical protein [Pseudomonas phage PIP]